MIRIDKDYLIDTDGLCYTVKQDMHKTYVDKKTGIESPVYKDLAYVQKLSFAFNYVAEHKTKKKLNEKEYSLAEAIEIVREIHDDFSKLIKNALKEKK